MAVIRYAIANIDGAALAALVQDNGEFAGASIWSGFGAGAWGVEPTTFLEFCGANEGATDLFVSALCATRGEVCALKLVNGTDASLLYATGAIEALA